jgi:hypothetical protein
MPPFDFSIINSVHQSDPGFGRAKINPHGIRVTLFGERRVFSRKFHQVRNPSRPMLLSGKPSTEWEACFASRFRHIHQSLIVAVFPFVHIASLLRLIRRNRMIPQVRYDQNINCIIAGSAVRDQHPIHRWLIN